MPYKPTLRTSESNTLFYLHDCWSM